jgi:phosphoglycerate-specific signal transduction histidine kinase
MRNRTRKTMAIDFDPEMIQSKPLTENERKNLSLVIQRTKAQLKSFNEKIEQK